MKKEGEIRIPSGCAIAAMINRNGKGMDVMKLADSMKVMHERSNGLGGGFAGYGIYPEYADCYAFHMFYRDRSARKDTEKYLQEGFDIVRSEMIRTRKMKQIVDEPVIWRYFLVPLVSALHKSQKDADDFTSAVVTRINSGFDGAYVFSSGKNMGVFKAVGYPEDVACFYRLEEYEGYAWTAHGRYPTNTPGWWGGAHPFSLLDYSVVHNGEISSYDANRRYIEMYGYKCTLKTDTEVITYILDYLLRREKLDIVEAAKVLAAPFWSTIARMDKAEAELSRYLRMRYPSLLVTGPFSIIFGFEGGLMALNDRLKLRQLVVGEKDDEVFFASEEAAIRVMSPELDRLWYPKGGEPVVIRLKKEEL